MEGQGAGEVILTGAQSDFCVAATVKGALANGLKVTVVSDAHSTIDANGVSAATITASKNIEFGKAGATMLSTGELIKRK